LEDDEKLAPFLEVQKHQITKFFIASFFLLQISVVAAANSVQIKN